MARTKISEFSATPGNNTDIDSINIAEGCAPSGINDAIRELMAQLKDFQTGAVGDSFNGPVGTTTAAAGAFTTLSASSTVTLSGGTANGVPYLNGSKVLTSGSALVFDGTNLGIGTSSPSFKLDVNGIGYFRDLLYVSGSHGISTDSASPLLLKIGGTEKMRLDSSGNLGLGVTPSAWATSLGLKALQISGTGCVYNYAFGGNNFTAIADNSFLNSGGSPTYIATNTASQYTQSAGQHRWFTAPSGTAGNTISFTQAMTLDASGNLILCGTSLSSPGTVNKVVSVRADNGSDPYVQIAGTTTTEQVRIQFYNGNGLVGSVKTNGSATAYNTSSDYRLKNITGPLTTSGAYIDSLNPVEGTWKADGSTFVGLIAHEAQEASRTQVATGTKDGEEMQGMSYSSPEMIANMIAELKALRARVAALEAA